MAAERTPKFDFVADGRHVMKELRNFAIRQALYSKLYGRGRISRRRDRVTAHCSVAIRRSQSDIDVLTCDVPEWFGQPKEEALNIRRLLDDSVDHTDLPRHDLCAAFSHGCIVARATDRRKYDSRAPPKSRARRAL